MNLSAPPAPMSVVFAIRTLALRARARAWARKVPPPSVRGIRGKAPAKNATHNLCARHAPLATLSSPTRMGTSTSTCDKDHLSVFLLTMTLFVNGIFPRSDARNVSLLIPIFHA
jgi:hypothetical protein